MKVFFRYLIFTVLLILFSCRPSSQLDIDLSEVDYNPLTIKRYEKALFGIDTDNIREGLENIRYEFSFFMPEKIDTFDIISIRNYITDPSLRQSYLDIDSLFADLSDIEDALNNALKHMKYYFPEHSISAVYSYVSGFDFEHPVKFADSVLIIALDMYMGKNYYFYPMIGIPRYLSYSMRKEYIVRDCMEEIIRNIYPERISGQTFLDKMIYEGKVLYFLDATLPNKHDTIKIVFTNQQLEWCKRNEGNVWGFFIDQNFLHIHERNIINRFMNDGPFTPSFAKESPARTGAFIGWQIVRSFMDNNRDVTIKELFELDDAQKILNNSRYRPPRPR